MIKRIQADAALSAGCRIALVVSLFNREVTDALLEGALAYLIETGVARRDITVVEVPGAVEIPLTAQILAKKNEFNAIIALGAVIRGETSHYDYVCHYVTEGCLRVALTFDIPVVFGVLTTENEAQAWDRLGGAHGHKGRDAAQCALTMQRVLKQLQD